jgi:hypothetical protein
MLSGLLQKQKLPQSGADEHAKPTQPACAVPVRALADITIPAEPVNSPAPRSAVSIARLAFGIDSNMIFLLVELQP